MTLLNDPAAYTIAATAVTAALAYLSDRFANRRASVADTLVAALRDGQRSRFLLDLAHPDHSQLVSEPVGAWMAAVYDTWEDKGGTALPGGETLPGPDDCLKKFDEVLSWRVAEREARIRFAVVARSQDIRRFAEFHRGVRETREELPDEYERSVDQLIRTVVSVRVPSLLRPFNLVARKIPLLCRLLVADDDVRVLVADFSHRVPVEGTIPPAS